ncbi:unnamed protein product [Mytilus coruscus]|uniref:Acyl-CoA dehydrogenase 11-like C-terminal domain-containing protein n=1 Tax=Mytilus coruscus TaxID=42192 RepID=A0A6J8DE82_MYTCO|nr:unnamed protein product [Mytilus coruscus]
MDITVDIDINTDSLDLMDDDMPPCGQNARSDSKIVEDTISEAKLYGNKENFEALKEPMDKCLIEAKEQAYQSVLNVLGTRVQELNSAISTVLANNHVSSLYHVKPQKEHEQLTITMIVNEVWKLYYYTSKQPCFIIIPCQTQELNTYHEMNMIVNEVFTIWERTTNILSLDVLRCISKSNGQALISLKNDVDNKLCRTPPELSKEAEKLQMALESVLHFVTKNQENFDVLTFAATDLSYNLSRIYMGKNENFDSSIKIITYIRNDTTPKKKGLSTIAMALTANIAQIWTKNLSMDDAYSP